MKTGPEIKAGKSRSYIRSEYKNSKKGFRILRTIIQQWEERETINLYNTTR